MGHGHNARTVGDCPPKFVVPVGNKGRWLVGFIGTFLCYDIDCNKKELTGHILDVDVAKFFPSGKVILSGGADLALKIWSLENDGLCAAQLKGHKRGKMLIILAYFEGVTSCDFVDRGRNVVSCSKDGQAILWNVPTQEVIHKWSSNNELNSCSLFPHQLASSGEAQGIIHLSLEITSQTQGTSTPKETSFWLLVMVL